MQEYHLMQQWETRTLDYVLRVHVLYLFCLSRLKLLSMARCKSSANRHFCGITACDMLQRVNRNLLFMLLSMCLFFDNYNVTWTCNYHVHLVLSTYTVACKTHRGHMPCGELSYGTPEYCVRSNVRIWLTGPVEPFCRSTTRTQKIRW